ncbi:stretch-activated cation channel mid1 [Gryganskiella cystojenkinii]|nr:stretch-activated cation channel mid1 [Gryganskiella cystojenkinii]
MLHNPRRSWRQQPRAVLLAITLCSLFSLSTLTNTQVFAQQSGTTLPGTTSAVSSSSAAPSTQPQPSPIPIPAPPPPTTYVPLPPGTREIQDSQVVEDRVSIGQLQTYHFAIAQQHQSLPVRRQLERILFHPGVESSSESGPRFGKRQAPATSSAGGSNVPTPSGTATSPPAPTRTIVPTLPPPFSNGTYAVFISISTCQTPKTSTPNIVCSPLTLYVSTSASQPLPGPGQDPKIVRSVTSVEGIIQFTAYTSQDIFFSLQGPALDSTWSGDWAVEVGASSQGYVQRYQTKAGLTLDDTDSLSASFLTANFTAVPPFRVYMINSSALPLGLSRSVCAIEVVQPLPLTKTSMTITQTNRTSNLDGSMGTEILPEEPTFEKFGQRRQVFLQGLNPGTDYIAFFVTDILNQAGAESLFAFTAFKTKRHDNCMLITDLEFCHEVAYAVPVTSLSILQTSGSGGNPNGTIRADVRNFYDDFTSNLMDNFKRVLGQYDCTKSQYSLIRNCTDCERAYRRWLCAINIPRCTDVEDITDPNNVGYVPPATAPDPNVNENPYLIDRTHGAVVTARNTSTSRGAIAQLTQNPLLNPGDYGEVLPCIDLCFDVVQGCPNFLGFNCPVKNMVSNYARMNSFGFQCNGLGVVPVPSSGHRAFMRGAGMMTSIVAVVALLFILI